MSKRIVVSSLVGAVALGGIALGGIAWASTPAKLAVENGSARYVAPTADAKGSLTYTVKVTDDSGVKGLKVLAWPKSSDLKPTAEEMADVESATCEKSTVETFDCTYTLAVSREEAAEMPEGAWNISVLATAKDGDTLFVPEAAAFNFTH